MIDIFKIEPYEPCGDLKTYAIGIYGAPGTGKAQPLSTNIPTPNGWKQLGDLKIGDFVFNQQGKPVEILNIFPQGEKEVYEIIFSDGRKTKCCEEHLWSVYTSRKNLKTLPLKEMLDDFKIIRPNTHNSFYYKYKIPTNYAVEYENQNLPIDPYIVGVFIGDGCTTSPGLVLSSADEEIPREVARILNCDYEKTSNFNYNWTFFNGKNNYNKRQLIQTREIFEDLPEIIGKSYEKKIPYLYLISSIEDRLSLLQGLLDTDGSVSKTGGRVSFSTNNYELAQDVVELSRSLGFLSSLLEREREKNNEIKTEYTVNIFGQPGNKISLFRLNRKKERILEYLDNEITKFSRDCLSVKDIVKTNKKEQMACLLINDPQHLYLTEDFIVTHNTSESLNASKPLLVACEPGYKAHKGVLAADILSWTDILTVNSQLKRPEAIQKFDTIIIDTLDELVFYAEQHIFAEHGVKNLTEIPWGGGYLQLAAMFRKLFKDITKNYGLIVIAHADIKIDADDPEKIKYATLGMNKKVKKIVVGLLDVLAYVEGDRSQPNISRMHFRSSEGWEAKTRFKRMVDEDIFSYNNLVKAVQDALGPTATREYKPLTQENDIEASQEEFENLRNQVNQIATEKIEKVGLQPVLDLIDITLGCKINATSPRHFEALKVLMEEVERL